MMQNLAKKYLISIHSVIDVITNSSTEIFIIDESKIEESFKAVFQVILKEMDYNHFENTVTSLVEYNEQYPEDMIVLTNGGNPKNVYVLDVDYHDNLLTHLVEKHFNPLTRDVDYHYSYED